MTDFTREQRRAVRELYVAFRKFEAFLLRTRGVAATAEDVAWMLRAAGSIDPRVLDEFKRLADRDLAAQRRKTTVQ